MHHFIYKNNKFPGMVHLPKTLPDGEGINHLPEPCIPGLHPAAAGLSLYVSKRGECVHRVCPTWNVMAYVMLAGNMPETKYWRWWSDYSLTDDVCHPSCA